MHTDNYHALCKRYTGYESITLYRHVPVHAMHMCMYIHVCIYIDIIHVGTWTWRYARCTCTRICTCSSPGVLFHSVFPCFSCMSAKACFLSNCLKWQMSLQTIIKQIPECTRSTFVSAKKAIIWQLLLIVCTLLCKIDDLHTCTCACVNDVLHMVCARRWSLYSTHCTWYICAS